MKLRLLLFTAIFWSTSLFLYNPDCDAHTRSKGKSAFHLNDDGFIQIQIGMTTLDFLDLADVDLGSPNAGEQAELEAERFLLRYFPKYLRINLTPGSKKCPVKFKRLERTDHKNIELYAFAQCPQKDMPHTEKLRIDWGLFTGTILMHRSFASFYLNDQLQQNWVFSRKEPKQILSIKTPSYFETGVSFFKEGFWHFMTGYDHISFLLLLFLLCAHIKSLFLLVSGFTIAHGSSLMLSYFDLLRIPSNIVELGIAFSIIVSAVHLLRAKKSVHIIEEKLDKRLFFVVLGFGLLHGLGFATLLKELLQESPFLWTGLFSFHFGLELAQLVFLVFFFLCTFKAKKHQKWPTVQKCLAAICGLAGLFWMIERLL